MKRMALALSWAFALHLAACGAGEPESVENRCERVRDRMVALEIPLADPDREALARVMKRAMGDQFIASCIRSMTEKQRDCVFAAADSKTAFACTHTTSSERQALGKGKAD